MRFHAGWIAAGYLLTAGCPANRILERDDGGESGIDVAPDPMGFEAVASEDPALTAVAAGLPADWTGTGILATRSASTPGAPAWTEVEAEVIDEDGKRYLRTSGEVRRIKNAALARTAAGNRARALLAQWLGTNRLVGSEITDVWGVPRQNTYARARIRVPLAWQPGMHIVPSPSGATDSDVSAPSDPNRTPQSNGPEATPIPQAPVTPTTEKL